MNCLSTWKTETFDVFLPHIVAELEHNCDKPFTNILSIYHLNLSDHISLLAVQKYSSVWVSQLHLWPPGAGADLAEPVLVLVLVDFLVLVLAELGEELVGHVELGEKLLVVLVLVELSEELVELGEELLVLVLVEFELVELVVELVNELVELLVLVLVGSGFSFGVVTDGNIFTLPPHVP